MSSSPAQADSLGTRRRGLRGRLRDARMRVKLGLILIIPVVAVLVLATDRIVQHGQQARDMEVIRSLAGLSISAADVIQEVEHERMNAGTFQANKTAPPDQ